MAVIDSSLYNQIAAILYAYEKGIIIYLGEQLWEFI